MGLEFTRNMPLNEVLIETHVCVAKTKVISGKKMGILPILRAGLGMVDGMLRLLPMAKVGHMGLYREPDTLKPVKYYCKLPSDAHEREIVVLEPMLATGGTASAAIGYLKENGITGIKLMCLVASEDGIDRLRKEHPDVMIFCASIDKKLDSHGYILPGLGDAGIGCLVLNKVRGVKVYEAIVG